MKLAHNQAHTPHTDSLDAQSHLCTYTSPAVLDKRKRVKTISLNCFLDGGESALSRPVGRGGAVRSLEIIGRASLRSGKEGVPVLVVLVDQRGNDSVGSVIL